MVAAALGDKLKEAPLEGLDGYIAAGQTVLPDFSACPWHEFGIQPPKISGQDPAIHVIFPIERPAPDMADLHGFEVRQLLDGSRRTEFFVCHLHREGEVWRNEGCIDR